MNDITKKQSINSVEWNPAYMLLTGAVALFFLGVVALSIVGFLLYPHLRPDFLAVSQISLISAVTILAAGGIATWTSLQ